MLHKLLIRLLVLLILLSGAPVDTGSIFAQERTTKQDDKTPGRSKKRPVKRPSSTTKKATTRKTPTRQSKSSGATTRKKRPATKKPTSTRPSTRKKATSTRPSTSKKSTTSRKKPPSRTSGTVKRKASTRPPTATSKRRPRRPAPKITAPKINTVKLADDIYNLTDELSSSNRQMEQALSYLHPISKRQLVRLDSKPSFSLSELERSANNDLGNVALQRQLAREYEKRHELNRAKDIYLRLVYQQPRNADTHYYLGSFYSAVGEMRKAENAFNEALAIDPDHQATLDIVASLPGRQNKSVPGVGKEDSYRKNEKGAAGLMTSVKRQLEAGNTYQALDMANEAQEEYPQQGGFAYLKGQAFEQLNEYDAAKTAYQKATRLNPDNLEAHQALANLYFSAGNYLYSALSYAQAIRLNPISVPYRYQLGLAYYLAGEWVYAAAAWEDLLYYAPNHPDVRNYLPQVYYVLATEYNRAGESIKGRTSFDKALSINSNAYSWLPGALTTLGKHYRENKMFKESLASFQEVIELRPKEADTYTEIGITYWKMNEKRLARAAWQRSLELNPDSNAAQGWLLISRQTG